MRKVYGMPTTSKTMTNYQVADVTTNDDGEVTQFLLFWDGGEPETKKGTPENLLLFDPQNELPFDDGLHDFFVGEQALKLSDEPPVYVSQLDNYSYVVRYDESVFETTPSQAADLLEAVRETIVEGDLSAIDAFATSVLEKQVRRDVVNALRQTFEDSRRIEVASNGWLIDDFFIVDWEANLYTRNDDPDEGDYIRSGQSVVQKDTSYEFVQLRQTTLDPSETDVSVSLGGTEYDLSERELLFLSKVKWILRGSHYHPDNPFWSYVDRWTDVEESSDEPNLSKFSI